MRGNKYISKINTCAVAILTCAFFQSGLCQDISLPSFEILERKYATDGNTIQGSPLDPEDFHPREKNQLSVQDSMEIAAIVKVLENALAKVPERENGKAHQDFKTLQQLAKAFHTISTTKDRTVFFDTIHDTCAVVSSNEQRSNEISSAATRLSDVRYAYIREMGFEVSEKSAELTQETQSRFIDLFCNPFMVQEPDWEDLAMPIDSAGIFITNHERAAEILKQKNLKAVESYLAGCTDNDFFKRYEPEGDGMPMLKTKYAANKAAIQTKFAEVLAHASELEAKNK